MTVEWVGPRWIRRMIDADAVSDRFQLHEGEIPAPEEYCELRRVAGLSPKSLRAAHEGLPRSLYSATVREDGHLVAMGRVVGDGLHVQIVDIAVRPDRQGLGLSRRVMESLMRYVERAVDPSAVVSLLADVDWLYQKFGFEESERSTAMLYRRRP